MTQERRNKKSSNTVFYGIGLVTLLAAVIIGIEIVRYSMDVPATNSPATENASTKSFPRELRDAAGETLTIQAKPSRIASQTLGTDEILFAICSPENIVALSKLAEDPNFSNVVEQAKQIPNGTTQGAEQILRLQPDLIFVASYSRAETVEILKASKAPVFRFENFDSIEAVKSNIRMVGYATGCDEGAERLVNQMDQQLLQIRHRIPQGEHPPRVMSFRREGYTAGADTLFDGMVRAAGATNVSAEKGITRFARISAEKVAEWDPDFIVIGANRDEMESKRQQLLADPLIASTKAGKAGNIIVIDNRYFLTVSHNIIRGVEILANELYENRKRNN